MNITIKEDGAGLIAAIEGRLDTVSAPAFEENIRPLIEHSGKEITLDCSNLEYISSSGLRQFLALRKAMAAKGGKLIIAHVNPGIKDIFAITGFLSLFEFK
jgi:anti-sigma B factor antagonist